MNVVQGKMARAALDWNIDDLAAAAGISRRTVLRFENDESVQPDTIGAMREAFEAKGVRFIMSGEFRHAVVPPKPKPIEDMSGGNPLLPRSGRRATGGD